MSKEIPKPMARPASVNEPEFKRQLRSLGIASAEEWAHWARTNASARQRLYLPVRPQAVYRNPGFWKEYGGQYPHYWGEFQRSRLSRGGELSRQQLARWARFASRYKVASAYRGIRFSGMSAASARGYSAAFGVFLAYSALEACWTAMGSIVQKAPGIIGGELASRLRATLGGSFPLDVELSAPLRRRVAIFMGGDAVSHWLASQNVLVMAQAVRHLVAHGVFTPSGARAVTAKAARALQDLADVVLRTSSDTFRDHVWPEIYKTRFPSEEK